MPSRTNYYFASSPRHLMLFAGLALEAPADEENHLFFIEHIPARGVQGYLAMLEAWPGSPFAQCRVLEGDWRPALATGASGDRRRAKNRLKKSFRRNNRQVIERALDSSPPDSIFVGIDNYYEVQLALHLASQRNPDLRRVYVEDGCSAYEMSYRNLHIRDLPKEWFKTLRFGLWWKPCTLAGTSGWVDEAYVAYPELVLDQLKALELHELPRAVYHGDDFLDLARIMGREFGVDVGRLAELDVLIAVTNTKWGSSLPNYVSTLVRLCEALLSAGKKVGIKLHPREQEPDPLGLGEREGLYLVPQQAMFEMLVVLVESSELTIIGDASSAMIGARWLRPDVTTIALRHDPDGVDGKYLQKVFDGIGVTIETELESLPERYFGVGAAVVQA